MSKSIYIIGAPGSGKSTLMSFIVEKMGLEWLPDEKVRRELWVNYLSDQRGKVLGVSLGVKRDSYSGTDALSMSVLPQALVWLGEANLPEYVLGEGARLSAPKFLTKLDQKAPLLLVSLLAPPEVLEERRNERTLTGAKELDSRTVKSATTRAANVSREMKSLGYSVLELETAEYTLDEMAEKVISRIH